MIEVKNLTKSFDGRAVLKDISTTFEDGKTNLIIGRSGSGKTVMIKNISGLMKPDTGQIFRIQGDRSCDGGTFHHTSTDLGRI